MANLAGVDESTVRRWQGQKAIRALTGPSQRVTEADALEVGAVKALVDGLGAEHALMAWKRVRAQLAGIGEPRSTIWVVWRPYQATLCQTDAEVGAAAATLAVNALLHRISVVQIGGSAIEARQRLRDRLGLVQPDRD